MDKKTAYDLIVEQLSKQFELPIAKITPEAHLFRDLGMDSIDALDMLSLLDKKWQVPINEEQAKRIRTVQDVVDYVMANLPPQH